MSGAEHPGRAALDNIDAALRQRPDPEGKALSRAVEYLSAWRDQMIGARDPALAQRLAHVNAAISVVMATNFPLGETPWSELEKARDWVALAVSRNDPASKAGV